MAAYLVSRHLGMVKYGVLFGIVVGQLALATGFGPLLIGTVYDRTQSYSGVLWCYIPLSLLTALLFATLGGYPVFAAPAAAGTGSGDEIGV